MGMEELRIWEAVAEGIQATAGAKVEENDAGAVGDVDQKSG